MEDIDLLPGSWTTKNENTLVYEPAPKRWTTRSEKIAAHAHHKFTLCVSIARSAVPPVAHARRV